jgi:starch synthase
MRTSSTPDEGEQPVIHLAAEYWPFARTGGLAEAVRGIARAQSHTGRRVLVFMPFYRRVVDRYPDIVPWGEPFEIQIGDRTETGRIHHLPPDPGEPHVLFVDHPEYFDRPELYGPPGGNYEDNHRRFAFFCRAALSAIPEICPGDSILHAHDWHTSLAAIYLRTVLSADPRFSGISTVLTVHNAGYQGYVNGSSILEDLGLPPELFDSRYLEWYGQTNPLKGGLVFSDMVTTVSPTHAHELRTRLGGFGLHDTFNALLDRFGGILNGIDYEVWDPETDAQIEAHFTAQDLSGKARCKEWLQKASGLEEGTDIPLFCMSARLVEQKGLDLVLGAEMIPRLGAQWIFLGQGEKRYQDALGALAAQHPDRVAVRFDFTEEREHQLMAGADFLLMPSLYEPCGLTQMRAQRYGALPVVRRVGGLADTVEDRVTGFIFDEYEPWALEEAVQNAINLYKDRKVWRWHVREAMKRDFSWEASVTRYRLAYRRAVDHHHGLDREAEPGPGAS